MTVGETSPSDIKYNESVFKFFFGGLINKVSNIFGKGDTFSPEELIISPENKMNLKYGAFGILLTALILTIGEIIFFYVVVIPNVVEKKNVGLNQLGYKLALKLRNNVNKYRQNIVKIKPITENDILNIFFYDFDNNSNPNMSYLNSYLKGSNMPAFSGVFPPFNIDYTNQPFDGISLPFNIDYTNPSSSTTESFDNLFDRKEYLKTRIINSELDNKIKEELLIIIDSPEDYQIQKKKVVLKLLDTKIPEKLAVLETMEAREKKLRDNVNIYVLITGFIIVIIVLFFLLKLIKSIRNDTYKKDFKDGFKYSIVSAIFTVLVIGIFQYTFFLLGSKYIYTINGLNLCGSRDIDALKFIYKKKYNKDISDEEAQEIIFKESLKDKHYLYHETYQDKPENCNVYGAYYNDETKLCHKLFSPCHYLKKNAHKYGNGKNELLELIMRNIKTR